MMDGVPNHIAIIPDGNRRWAKARGLDPWDGHRAGADNTEQLIRAGRELGIREFSIWGSSLGNLSKRPVREKIALLDIYSEYFSRVLESEDIDRDQVRIRCIGRWKEQFSEPLCKLLVQIEEKTKSYDRFFLNFFLAYSGVDDMTHAFQVVAKERLVPDAITETTVKSHLMTAELSPVDFLIRTGGEPHLSAGFLMWDTAESQLYFSDQLYPDFGVESFKSAIAEYGIRARRFGI